MTHQFCKVSREGPLTIVTLGVAMLRRPGR